MSHGIDAVCSMKIAELPKDELERLQELKTYDVLDTKEEQTFDELTSFVAGVCEVPIVLVGLVDENRQWFKSRYGLKVTQTPRDYALCAHAILQKEIFIVEDTSLDDRFKDNPLVVGHPFVRFYAGMPLRTSLGFNIGTLCIIDHKPKKLSPLQINALGVIAKQVMLQFDLKRLIQKQSILLSQLLKMASLGELTSGIAHEINNPLAIISAKTQQAVRQIEAGVLEKQLVLSCLEKTQSMVNRIARTIKGLKRLARNDQADPMEKARLSQIVDETLELCRLKIKENDIKLDVKIESDVVIECRPTQISQVLMNLLLNSIDAIESLNDKWIGLEVFNKEDFVEIAVTDSGRGITKQVLEKMMSPFFTTKKPGKGTGLGLSISRKIINDHQGRLFYDETSRHTKFIITLPKYVQSPQITVA